MGTICYYFNLIELREGNTYMFYLFDFTLILISIKVLYLHNIKVQ